MGAMLRCVTLCHAELEVYSWLTQRTNQDPVGVWTKEADFSSV
jgi:hypothetical protein